MRRLGEINNQKVKELLIEGIKELKKEKFDYICVETFERALGEIEFDERNRERKKR